MSEAIGTPAVGNVAAPQQQSFEAPQQQTHQESADVGQLRAWAEDEQTPEHRLAGLPPAMNSGTVQHPFREIDREAYLEAVRGKGIAARSHNAPIAKINIAELIAIQGSINSERVEQHLANPYMYAPGTRAPGHGMLIDRPVVVRLNGQLYVHDGHHRLTATWLRGLTTAKVRLVDLDV